MILILYVQVDIQTSYGQQQPALPSLRIKVQMDKAVIAQGNTQTIEFQVSDAMTHQPIGGAVTSGTSKISWCPHSKAIHCYYRYLRTLYSLLENRR